RADFRLDESGTPRFLEMNPLPTFAREGSFGIIAELQGRPLEELLAEILASALARLGLTPMAWKSDPRIDHSADPSPHTTSRAPEGPPQGGEAAAQRAEGERSQKGRGAAPSPRSLPVHANWRSWTWQLQNRIRDVEALERWIAPTPDEREAIDRLSERFHFV